MAPSSCALRTSPWGNVNDNDNLNTNLNLYDNLNAIIMADIFSRIAAGEIPSYKCAENEQFYAFLDINPVAVGHTLVIPRREVDYIFDMDDEEIADFQKFAKQVAIAIKKAFPCKKVAQVVLGLEVPHAHIHLIPMNTEADVDFRREKLKLSEEEFRETAAKIFNYYTNN